MKKKFTICGYLLIFCILLSHINPSIAQDSISGVTESKTKYIDKAFWGTRVLNGHSLETTRKGMLDFAIQHRLGRLDGGFNELFGLDQASVRLGLEYGVLDWIMVGAGRSTLDKYYNGFIKARILRQSEGEKNMPLSLTALADMGIESGEYSNPERKNYFSSRLYYTYQLIAGGNYWNRISVQITPTWIHRNLVTTTKDHNDVFALGFGGRVRITDLVAISAEYYYVFPNQIISQVNGSDTYNNFSFGVEIFTGKHVFQVFMTNAVGSTEKQFITENTESWLKDGIHFGFNLTRLFSVAHY